MKKKTKLISAVLSYVDVSITYSVAPPEFKTRNTCKDLNLYKSINSGRYLWVSEI